MKKNKKINYIIIIVLLIIIVILAFKFLYKDNSSSPIATDTPTSTVSSDISDTTSDKLDLVSYQVYKDDSLDFGFVIANIRVRSNVSAEVLDLNNYETDEQINLGDISNYDLQLQTNGYYLGKENVYYSLIASEDNYFAKIFIPFTDLEKTTLSITNSINDFNMDFDLTTNAADIATLEYTVDDVISDNSTYSMTVSKAYQATTDSFTRTFSDGTVISDLFGSNSKLYAFQIEATSLNNEVVSIESAQYVVANENDSFDALSAEYQSDQYENIVGKLITDNSKGYLFFVTYDPDNQKITYKGKLSIKLTNIETPITIDVDIE